MIRVPRWAMHRVLASCLISLCVIGCSDGPGSGDDAATDLAGEDVAEEGLTPTPPELPAPPVFTPCPDGWREVEDPDTGIVTCDPWPGGGPEECGPDEAHFPGEPGCTRIGSACPTGDWADDLPTDREILYVRAGEPDGGDGTIGSPFGTIAAAVAAADPLTVIALSKGTFDGQVSLLGGITLWGACVAETVVTCTAPSDVLGTINVMRPDTAIRNLTVSGQRRGVHLTGDSRSITITDVVIADVVMAGLSVIDGATADCTNLVIRDTACTAAGEWGRAIQVQNGGRVDVSRGVFKNNHDAAIGVFMPGSTVTMQDVAVLDTQSLTLAATRGRALQVQRGASAEVTRGVFEGNRESAITVTESGASLTLEDVVVRDTLCSEHDGYGGHGLSVEDGGVVTASRVLFARNRDNAVAVLGTAALLTMSDVAVLDTAPRDSDRAGGRALGVQWGARVEVTRGAFLRSHNLGLYAHEATLVLVDVRVSDTRSRESDQQTGRGLHAQVGAQVEVTRGVFESNRDVGVAAFFEGTLVTMADVTISDTLERACVVDTCAGFGSGFGVISSGGAHVEMSRFVITESALCAVQLAFGTDMDGESFTVGGTMDLHDGEISHNPCGANVQNPDFDVARLIDGVLYLDNDINLDMAELPVPDMGVDL
jgi:hypothetical protein